MAFRPTPSSQDRHAYIPPQMKQALAQHMQQSVPAHLKNYQADGRAFIPTHVEKAIVDHMQKSVPAHMKQYVGAYVQQNVAFPATMPQSKPSVSVATPPVPRVSSARPPVPQIPRQSGGFNRVYEGQGQSTLELLKSDLYPQAPTPITPTQPPPKPDSTHPYEFIMNPDQPTTSKKPLLPGTEGSGVKALALRIGLAAAGLIVLLILFSVVRGLLSGGGNQPLYMAVAQDQTELIHLTTDATTQQQQGLTTNNNNFAATAKLSLTTAKSDMITYMGKTGIKKIDPKVINLKVSAQTDKQLADAAVASTYNQTFREIMKTKLKNYQQDLQLAYDKTTGPNGRKLLSNQYDQAELLLKQLEAPAQS